MEPFLARWEDLLADAVGPPGLPSSPLLMARFGLSAARPVYDLARSLFKEPRGQGLFAGTAAHAVLPFDRLASSAIGLMLSAAGHAVGWPFPRGGARSIPKALASLLTSLGGVIRTGVTIERLAQVESSGPVFFQTSPQAMAGIAGDAFPPSFRKRLQAYRFGPGIFKVDWALSEPIPWRDEGCRRAATVHLGGTLEELGHAEKEAFEGRLCERPYVLLTQPSLWDDSRAPAGQHTAWGYCHVPNGDIQDQTGVIEAQVERYAPGFGDVILARHSRNTRQVEDYCPNFVGGDINVGRPTWDQLLSRPTARLNPYGTPDPRLFICSAASPPGGGVHGLAGANAVRSAGLSPAWSG